MKKIKAIPVGGDTYAIFIDEKFWGNVENEGTSFDAAEDFLISIGEDTDNYEIIEA